MCKVIDSVDDALKVAKEAEKEEETGMYPTALMILAKHIEDDRQTPYAYREYKICYIENGKRHLCGKANSLAEAERILENRKNLFDPLEVVLLEKEVICREIKYQHKYPVT